MKFVMEKHVGFLLKTIYFLCFAGVTSIALADELVGSDGGSMSVGNSGQASWTMPVEVPSGINGVAPNLTLSVSSSGGNGSLGVGGGLSGLSSIARCGKTIHQDGFFQAPQFQISDAYCLDGARLVLESGSYGVNGSVYRTEIESFQRITAHGNAGSAGPAYFTVNNSNGATMYFGERTSTRDVDTETGAVAVWKIDKLVDSNTNTLHYNYEDVSGENEVQLKSITYGGNTSKSVTEHLSVELVYEDRPDTFTTWSRGQQYSQTQRISNIQTKVGGTLVKDYRLSYEQGDVTNASRLSELQLCAGNGDCYRPTRFDYAQESDTDWVSSSVSIPSTLQTADGKPLGTVADINNDGLSDWVVANISDSGASSITTWLGSLDGWTPSAAYALPDALFDYSQTADGYAKGFLIDVNGDGWPEYVQAYQMNGETTTKTWRNTGAGFVVDASLELPTPLLSVDTNNEGRSLADLADLNADGLIDIVQSIKSGTTTVRQTWIHQFNQGQHSWVISANYQTPTIATDYTQGTDGRVFATLQDVNGDGLSDWVQSYTLNNVSDNKTWLNTGQGFSATVSTRFSLPAGVSLFNYDMTADGVAEYTLSDLNGDGLPDLSKALWYDGARYFDAWVHTGLGWQQDDAYNLPLPTAIVHDNGGVATVGGLTELNGDGRPDFVRSYQTVTGTKSESFWVYDLDQGRWVASNDYALPFINYRIQADGSSIATAEVLDLDHDGYPEMINSVTGAVYQSGQSDQPSGLLVKTTNPLGGTTELTYGITTDRTLYELAPQTPYPNVAYNAPARVIKEIAASNGIGGMISAMHSYGNAKTNVLGQGGFGYAYHTMEDGNSGVQVTTMFHQTYPYAGRIKDSERQLNGVMLSSSTSEIEVREIVINGLTTLYPHPNSSEAQSYDADGNLLTITRSTSEIDGFGNATSSTESVFNDQNQLVRRNTTVIEYKAPELADWIFGLPIKNTVTVFDQASGGSFTNVSEATYFDDGKPKTETLEPRDPQSVATAYDYDGFGNRTSTTITAAGIQEERTSSVSFSKDGRFPKVVKNALDNAITTTFDELLGKPNTITDANGKVKQYYYDAFGTVIKESYQHQDDGTTRGQDIVMTKWCDEDPEDRCPDNAVYYVFAINDDGDAPESAYFDVNGRELMKHTLGFNGKPIGVVTEYNADGQVLRVTQPYYLEEEQPLWTEYEYDDLGRQVRRENAAGSVFETIYDGLTITTRNPGNKDSAVQESQVTNNIFGQPLTSKDPDGNITQYEYDGRGKLVKTIDSAGNIATITYDDIFGRKIAMDDPDLGAWAYEYDALGNLIAQTDAIGQRTELEYDILNRLVRRVDDIGGSKEQVSTWEYSSTNTVGSASGAGGDIIGGLKRVASPGFSRSLKYDDLSRIVEATSTVNSREFTQRTGYLGNGDKVDWIQYPSGLSVRNTYDDYGFPSTVEGVELNYDAYLQFQAESRNLNKAQRDLEAYKDAQLTDAELYTLEAHEREVRRLGGALGDFYEVFDDNQERQTIVDEAQEYSDLIDRVQQKLDQHTNWYNYYQKELETLVDRIQPDIDRLNEIPDEIKPYEDEVERLEPSYNNHIRLANGHQATVVSWSNKANTEASALNRKATEINNNVASANAQITHVNNLVRSLIKQPHADRYINGDVTQLFRDFDCCTEHVLNNYSKTLNPDLINSHLTQMSNYLSNYADITSRIDRLRGEADDIEDRYDYNISQANHYQWRVEQEIALADGFAARINAESTQIDRLINEHDALSAKVQPDSDRINNYLAPIVQSHNNVLISYNDRAREYVAEISLRNGTYAKRDDLKSENFLKPFLNHIEYIKCMLRDGAANQGGTTTGECYAEHLVHVYNDDGSVDTAEQALAREEVEPHQIVDIRRFWSLNRFFCPRYYGYYCAAFYRDEIQQLAKTMHWAQCSRMTTEQKEDSLLPCDSTEWNNTYTAADGTDKPRYPYLITGITRYGLNNIAGYQIRLANKHQAEVSRLVTSATLNTYNAETTYSEIIQPGGNLWQANLPAEVEEGDEDPRDYVLLRKGRVQALSARLITAEAREAHRELKGHQYAIAQLINDGDSRAYDRLYLAVQDKAAEVDRLYREIDQRYANAAEDDDLDSYDEQKKIYWQANDINSKGQILEATYGNGTNTTWTYDQFGRMNSHFTKRGSAGLVNIKYEYDEIGNLTQRYDSIEDVVEDFSYDNLNRLVSNSLSGSGTQSVTQLNRQVVDYRYDELGNITYKSDVAGGGINGAYTYGSNAGPHAVTSITGVGNFTYDKNGNQLTGRGRNITYSAFNKPTRIDKDGKLTYLNYGPERQLVRQQQNTPDGTEVTSYVGSLYEEIWLQGGGFTNRHYIAVAGNAIAVVETKPGSLVATKESYLHKNHQGSVVAISDGAGAIAERRYYDAFGDIKSYIGQAANQYSHWLGFASATTMGFTGHKTLVAAGVIHMGGRVYDASIGRFLSADPHIQAPLNSQSLNRYSYTLNNPLSFTDPSGYFFKSIFKALKKLFDKLKAIIKKVVAVVKKVVKALVDIHVKVFKFVKKNFRVIVAVVAAIAVPFAVAAALGTTVGALGLGAAVGAGALSGAVSGLITTGSFKGAFEGAIFGAVTAGFAKFVSAAEVGKGFLGKAISSLDKSLKLGQSIARSVISAAGHGIIGGLRSVVNGGKFFAGFVTATVSKAFTIGTRAFTENLNVVTRGLTVATVGGITSTLAGGSFKLGFLTAGLAFAANDVLSNGSAKRSVARLFASSDPADRQLAIDKTIKLYGINTSNANAGVWYQDDYTDGNAITAQDQDGVFIIIGPAVFNNGNPSDLAGLIWHESSHAFEYNFVGPGSLTPASHVAIYDRQRELQSRFGAYSEWNLQRIDSYRSLYYDLFQDESRFLDQSNGCICIQ